jgi:hypothetical protein
MSSRSERSPSRNRIKLARSTPESAAIANIGNSQSVSACRNGSVSGEVGLCLLIVAIVTMPSESVKSFPGGSIPDERAAVLAGRASPARTIRRRRIQPVAPVDM